MCVCVWCVVCGAWCGLEVGREGDQAKRWERATAGSKRKHAGRGKSRQPGEGQVRWERERDAPLQHYGMNLREPMKWLRSS